MENGIFNVQHQSINNSHGQDMYNLYYSQLNNSQQQQQAYTQTQQTSAQILNNSQMIPNYTGISGIFDTNFPKHQNIPPQLDTVYTQDFIEPSAGDELYQGYIRSRGRLPSYYSRQQIKDLTKSLNLSGIDHGLAMSRSGATQMLQITQNELTKLQNDIVYLKTRLSDALHIVLLQQSDLEVLNDEKINMQTELQSLQRRLQITENDNTSLKQMLKQEEFKNERLNFDINELREQVDMLLQKLSDMDPQIASKYFTVCSRK